MKSYDNTEISTQQAESEIRKRSLFKHAYAAIYGTPINILIALIDPEPTILKGGLDIDTRFTAFKGEKGWRVYLEAVFKQYDVRKYIELSLEPGEHFKNNLTILSHLIGKNGAWAITSFTPNPAYKANANLDYLIQISKSQPIAMPPIRDLDYLAALVKKVDQESREPKSLPEPTP